MPKTKTRPFDAARYIETPDDAAVFLTDALESGDIGVIAEALGAVARSRGMTDVAKAAGVSRESLYKSLSGDGNPALGTVVKVVDALGLRLTVAPI